MQFQILAFCLALLGCCLFISTGAVPTATPKDVASREVEVLDERKEGLMEIAARLPTPAAVMAPKKRRSLRRRSRGPGGGSDSDSHHDSDSDCAVTRKIRRSLKKVRAHGPGGDSDSHDSDSHCTDNTDSDEGVIATRAKASLTRKSVLAKRRSLETRAHGPGGDSDSGDSSHHSECDTTDTDSDEGTLARKSKKLRRSHGPGGDSDCEVTKKLRKAKKAKRSASYNIEEDLA